jgi:hypothetical protein
MAETEVKSTPARDLQARAFEKVEEWVQLRRRQLGLEKELRDLKARISKLEEDPAVQATKGAVRGAKKRLPVDASDEDKQKKALKRDADIRKRLEKKVRTDQDRPKNPNAGKKYPEDSKMT